MYSKMQKNLKFKLDGMTISASVEEPVYSSNITRPTPIKTLHYHVIYELLIMGDEPLTFFSENSSKAYKNCILCIPPFLKHSTTRKMGLRILFTFDKENKNSDFAAFMNSFTHATEPFVLEYCEELSFYIARLSELFNYDTPLTNEICISILKLIFYTIYTKSNIPPLTRRKKEVFSTNESYLSHIDGIINNEYVENVTLKKVADSLGLSTKQTSRIIKKNYQKTLSQLICEKRLSVATALLLTSNKTISEIVDLVNFSSESYFCRVFKLTHGCTPLKYKKMNLKNN